MVYPQLRCCPRGGSALTRTHTTSAKQATGSDGATRAKGGPVIEIDHVTKRFGDYIAVSEADFSIASGEFFSMLGPSGCGKTTTLRMIAGFETPTEGAIRLEGADVSRVPPHKRNVNTVFQHYALFPHMTVWDNVAYGPRSQKKDKAELRKRVDELLEIVRLTDFAQRKPAQLSGGQQQRVALARALVNYPSALLLDEPLGALDLKLRQVMQFELKRIQREVGITFVYVTHDQEEALAMSDRIAVLNRGRIEQVGTPLEVYERPQTDFVAGFIGISNLIERDGRHMTVRPEKILLLADSEEPPAGAHTETGIISDVVYVGVITRYIIDLDAGGELVVARQNEQSPATTQSARGTRARIAWLPDQTITISQGEGARP